MVNDLRNVVITLAETLCRIKEFEGRERRTEYQSYSLVYY
jgi:hypothetical protein